MIGPLAAKGRLYFFFFNYSAYFVVLYVLSGSPVDVDLLFKLAHAGLMPQDVFNFDVILSILGKFWPILTHII